MVKKMYDCDSLNSTELIKLDKVGAVRVPEVVSVN